MAIPSGLGPDALVAPQVRFLPPACIANPKDLLNAKRRALKISSLFSEKFLFSKVFYYFMDIKLGKYKHYKGNEYQVLGVAKHSEDLEEFVVYQALYGDKQIWIRPIEMFKGKVIVNGMEINRFEFLE